jgi:uncharacterized protein (TIGR03067 family)
MGSIGLLVVVVGIAIGADAPEQLQGSWKIISWEQEGQQLPDDVLSRLDPWNIKAGQITIYEVPGFPDTGSYKVSEAGGRQTIDIVVDGKLIRGIYATDGKTLKVCLAQPETGHRPKDFAAKRGSEQVYYVFKRVKP